MADDPDNLHIADTLKGDLENMHARRDKTMRIGRGRRNTARIKEWHRLADEGILTLAFDGPVIHGTLTEAGLAALTNDKIDFGKVTK